MVWWSNINVAYKYVATWPLCLRLCKSSLRLCKHVLLWTILPGLHAGHKINLAQAKRVKDGSKSSTNLPNRSPEAWIDFFPHVNLIKDSSTGSASHKLSPRRLHRKINTAKWVRCAQIKIIYPIEIEPIYAGSSAQGVVWEMNWMKEREDSNRVDARENHCVCEIRGRLVPFGENFWASRQYLTRCRESFFEH